MTNPIHCLSNSFWGVALVGSALPLVLGVESCPPDTDQDGYPANEDCDDANPAIHPDQLEVCDGIDQNCDGLIDEGVSRPLFADLDGDGHGSSRSGTQNGCSPAPIGFSLQDDDCHDEAPTAHPGGLEVCDGLDNDCDGEADNVVVPWFVDADGDGYGLEAPEPLTGSCALAAGFALKPGDCDDRDASSHPEAVEVLGDGIDQDCSGLADDCDPRLLSSSPWPVEGERITVQLECRSGAPLSAFETEVLEVPIGATADPTLGRLEWQTGLADGGTWPVSFRVRSLEMPTAPWETAAMDLQVADAAEAADNVPVDPALYLSEWGLPVIHLFPSAPLTEEYVPATVVFQGVTYTDVEMKIRGAASVAYPKNSFTLDFGDPNLDAAAFGLPDKDKLVLISTFDDNSYVRQKLAYDVWREMASFFGASRLVVRTFFAVVYLDGAYHGLYVAADHVDDQFAKQMGLAKSGNIFKAVDHNANFYTWDAYGNPKTTLSLGYEKKEGTPAEGEEGAFADLESLVAFSSSVTDEDFVAQAPSWLRPDEFKDWFLYVHYLSADDSGGKNAYLYNNINHFEFRYCPWDFNHAFGQDWLTGRVSSEAYNDFIWANGIFAHFQRSTTASTELWPRLSAMMQSGPLQVTWQQKQLESYYSVIDPSAERDFDHWREEYMSFYYWADYRNSANDWTDYSGEKAYLESWLERRWDYMKSVHPF